MPRFVRSSTEMSGVSTTSSASMDSDLERQKFEAQQAQQTKAQMNPPQETSNERFKPYRPGATDDDFDAADLYGNRGDSDGGWSEDDDGSQIGECPPSPTPMPPQRAARPENLPPPSTLKRSRDDPGPAAMAQAAPDKVAMTGNPAPVPDDFDHLPPAVGLQHEHKASRSFKVPGVLNRAYDYGKDKWNSIPQDKRDEYCDKAISVGKKWSSKAKILASAAAGAAKSTH